jgi:hypothetical protein
MPPERLAIPRCISFDCCAREANAAEVIVTARARNKRKLDRELLTTLTAALIYRGQHRTLRYH